MEISGAIKEDGCKYQSNCRRVYGSLSERIENDILYRWSLTLSMANSGSECGKPIPKCKICNFLENSEGKTEILLRKYIRDNWKIEVPETE